MSKISGLKKGDIVKIKFMEMRDIVNLNKKDKKPRRSYQVISEWELGSNILAFTYGGDFIVKEDAPASGKDQNLCVLNHLDGGDFEIAECIIESIQLVDAAQRFISDDHKVAIIVTENDIYINGEKLINTDEDKHLDNFVNLVERYLTNKAINNSLKGGLDA
jgi:hypothetical protein